MAVSESDAKPSPWWFSCKIKKLSVESEGDIL
jgi:hypothetical protein